VDSFADVTDGIHASPDWVDEGGVIYLSAKCVKDNYFVLSDAGQISQEQNRANPRTQARAGDVLLTTVGTIGNAAVVQEESLPANMDRHLGIIRIREGAEVDPYYLAIFLNSKFGRFQALRESTGNMQLNLFIAKINKLLVPTGDRYNTVGEMARQAYQKRKDSKALYAEAESLLLHELGLDTLDLAPQTSYTATFSQAQQSTRLDAEYFQPKYQRAIQLIGQSGKRIRDVAKLAKRRFKPQSGRSFEYIEIGNVTNSGYADSNTVMGEDAPSRAQWIVKSKDVITSTVRPIRRLSALVQSEQDGHVCSSGFAVLQPKNVAPELLLVYLRLPIICEILDLHTTASMYPAISTNDLMNIAVTFPENGTADQVVSKVQMAFQSRQDACHLLEETKRHVEQMILGTE
jgi:hypothetical protein